MTVEGPTSSELVSLCSELGFAIDKGEASELAELIAPLVDAYRFVDEQDDYLPPVTYARAGASRPSAADNPFNAWTCRGEIRGADKGDLAGRTVAVKDNVAVAGWPMANGSSVLAGFTPSVDATVVTRILDAGGTIVGKSECEFYCASGGSHTSASGPVLNPHDPARMSGGSSSGSAVLVATGQVDLAIGGDQGGSIRMPSSYSGTVGMKPTHTLVPYTGAIGLEATIDHLGPITRTVADSALFLEVLAGFDPLDPRQAPREPESYAAAVDQPAEGLRVGVLAEGFGTEGAEADVDEMVRSVARSLADTGAIVSGISIPAHADANSIFLPIALGGFAHDGIHANGAGTGRKGLHLTELVDAHAGWAAYADSMPISLKTMLLLGLHMQSAYGGRFYAKAQNLRRRLVEDYGVGFDSVDVLLMPTTPMKAQFIPSPDEAGSVQLQRAMENLTNTAPFDITGHPAISVPVGKSEGLPVGMMLVGRHFDEATLYRVAAAVESVAEYEGILPSPEPGSAGSPSV